MVKRTLAAVAAVLALGGAGWRVLAGSADDVGRDGSIIVHTFPNGHQPSPEDTSRRLDKGPWRSLWP